MPSLLSLRALKALANPMRAVVSQRFFKTGPGQYGEGDVFIGVTMPEIRGLVRTFREVSMEEIDALVVSAIHEARMLGLLLLVARFEREKSDVVRVFLYERYLAYAKADRVNNWDLVDVTAPRVVGAFLFDRPRKILLTMGRSASLWERRIAIISTLFFIQKGDASMTLRLAEMLLTDTHDLIHKAVGWMLREVGKRCSVEELEGFLDQHATEMPRTMLRYAIERLPEKRRRMYMGLKKI
jgi:3-methyladenine DNA glycosylase AlkD